MKRIFIALFMLCLPAFMFSEYTYEWKGMSHLDDFDDYTNYLLEAHGWHIGDSIGDYDSPEEFTYAFNNCQKEGTEVMIYLNNCFRHSEGLNILIKDDYVCNACYDHVLEMHIYNYLGHYGYAFGRGSMERIYKESGKIYATGENCQRIVSNARMHPKYYAFLAFYYLYNSKGHHDNTLDKDWYATGCDMRCYWDGTNYTYLCCINFRDQYPNN